MTTLKLLKIISYLAIVCSCNSSLIKSSDWNLEEFEVEVPTASIDPVTQAIPSTTPEPDTTKPLDESAPEILNYEEPEAIQNGQFFRLMITIVEYWNDEYMGRGSEKFLALDKSLCDELQNLTKSQGESIKFKLVEVRPVVNSLQKVYATFVVMSENELNGDDLSNSISSQIILYQKILTTKASYEGFIMENINEETAKELDGEKVPCESAEFKTDQSLNQEEVNVTSTTLTSVAGHREDGSFSTHSTCRLDKIQRGSTSIYIFEAVKSDDKGKGYEYDSEMVADEPMKTDDSYNKHNECRKDFKIPAVDEENADDETVVIIRKRGNKVFIEI